LRAVRKRPQIPWGSPSAGGAAAETGAATGEAADRAALDTAEAINESYETVDREKLA